MRTSSKKSIVDVYKSGKTVFTASDIAILWRESNRNNLRVRVKYFVDKGDLVRLRRGVYAKPKYDILEAANKVYVPSYVSCETVLREAGVVFQHYETTFAVSYLSRDVVLSDGNKICYRRIKNNMLLNDIGIERREHYMIATKERAFVDMVYLFGEAHYDNLEGMDWEVCRDIASAYQKSVVYNRVKMYQKQYAASSLG